MLLLLELTLLKTNNMAITTTPTLNSHMFSSEFQTLVLNGIMQPVTFAIYGSGSAKPILSARYFPDGHDSVTIYDLDVLLDTLPVDITASVRMTVDGTTLGPDAITIFKCSASMAEPAEDFIDDFFLTTSMGERNTALGRKELVTAYSRNSEQVSVTCMYRQDDGTVSSIEKVFDKVVDSEPGDIGIARASASTSEQVITTAAGVTEIDVSPELFALPGQQLISYVVACGKRKARYRVLTYAPNPDPSIIFRNCFNAWEIIHLTGKKETSGEYKRSSALIDGRMRTYHIDEVVYYKAMTGPLRPGETPVAMDLARTKDAYLVNPDGSGLTEITITDCEVKRSNEGHAIHDFTFTYRLAERRNARVAVVRPPRVFDKYFDATYE